MQATPAHNDDLRFRKGESPNGTRKHRANGINHAPGGVRHGSLNANGGSVHGVPQGAPSREERLSPTQNPCLRKASGAMQRRLSGAPTRRSTEAHRGQFQVRCQRVSGMPK